MVSAVIDTNVFVSAFLTRHEDLATIRVLRAMGSGIFVPLYNEAILSEYQGVLSRKKLIMSQMWVRSWRRPVSRRGIFRA